LELLHMTDKNSKAFKQLVREHQARTGMTYQAAMQDMKKPMDGETELREGIRELQGGGRLLDELLAAIGAKRATDVLLADAPTGAGSADFRTAQAQAHELTRLRLRVAMSGQGEAVVSSAEENVLLLAGAADGRLLTIVRAFRTERGLTVSAECPACGRWIDCGREERQASCECGRIHRVVFDATVDWQAKFGWVCMDCGVSFRPALVGSGESPWTSPNPWQHQCHNCRVARPDILGRCRTSGTTGPTVVYRNPSRSIVIAADRLLKEGFIRREWSEEGPVRMVGVKLTPNGAEYVRRNSDALQAK
jgi:hypothetical protein